MPNWCNNFLRIQSADPAILARYRAAIEGGRLLRECCPEPETDTYRARLCAPVASPEWREWLIENGFMGKEGQTVPHMSDEWIETISRRYIELYEQLIGKPFLPAPLSEEETIRRTEASLLRLLPA